MKKYPLLVIMAFVCLSVGIVFAQNDKNQINLPTGNILYYNSSTAFTLKDFQKQDIKIMLLVGRKGLMPGLWSGQYWDYWNHWGYWGNLQTYNNLVLGEYYQGTIYAGPCIRFRNKVDFYLITGPYRVLWENKIFPFIEIGFRFDPTFSKLPN